MYFCYNNQNGEKMNISKNNKSIILLIYAIIMFLTISSEVNLTLFFILFLVLPIAIYLFVKNIFPDNNKK